MKLDEDLWADHQYQVIVNFVYHLAYFRLLKECYDDSRMESEFWTRTIDAHLLRAITDWCMVFGTDSNKVHWKKVAGDNEAQDLFRSHLLSATGLTKEQRETYRSDMTIFRNKYAAHRTVAPAYPSVTVMDIALLFATAYDDWFRSSVAADPELARPKLQKDPDTVIEIRK